MKTRPIGVRSDLYDLISAEAQTRQVSMTQVLNEKLEPLLQASSTSTQSGQKPESNIADQMLGMNLL